MTVEERKTSKDEDIVSIVRDSSSSVNILHHPSPASSLKAPLLQVTINFALGVLGLTRDGGASWSCWTAGPLRHPLELNCGCRLLGSSAVMENVDPSRSSLAADLHRLGPAPSADRLASTGTAVSLAAPKPAWTVADRQRDSLIA